MPRRPVHLASTEGGRNPAKPHTQSEEGRAGRAHFFGPRSHNLEDPEASGAARPPRAHRTAEDAARHPSATCPPNRDCWAKGVAVGAAGAARRAAQQLQRAPAELKKGRGKPAGASPPLPPRHAARALAQQSHGCALPPTSPPSPSARSMGRRRARKRGAPTKLSARPLRDPAAGNARSQPPERARNTHTTGK